MSSTNCVLIGFMGSGKSTIARELQKRTNALILDSDSIISFAQNLSIAKIFELYGEQYFRDLEANFCKNVAKNIKDSIISTGGGMPVFCDVSCMGKVFYLHISFNEILDRLNENELQKRPLFSNKDSALELYNKRLSIYEKCADVVLGANKSANEIADEILKHL